MHEVHEVKDFRISFSKWFAFVNAFIIGAGIMAGILTVLCVTIAVVKAVH